MYKPHILVFLCLLLFTQAGFPQILWDDGLVHNIDSGVFSEPVHVHDSISSQPTTVNIFNLPAPEPPQPPPMPPDFTSGLWLYDNSQANISGGMINGLYCNDNSKVFWEMGRITGDIEMYGNSYLYMSVGFNNDILAYGSSLIEIVGGKLDTGIINLDGSFTPSRTFIGNENSQIIIDGTDFEIDGVGIGYGPIGFSSGVLKGTLADGILHANFSIADNASIVLVPEPTTILLFGIGGLLLRKRT